MASRASKAHVIVRGHVAGPDDHTELGPSAIGMIGAVHEARA